MGVLGTEHGGVDLLVVEDDDLQGSGRRQHGPQSWKQFHVAMRRTTCWFILAIHVGNISCFTYESNFFQVLAVTLKSPTLGCVECEGRGGWPWSSPRQLRLLHLIHFLDVLYDTQAF